MSKYVPPRIAVQRLGVCSKTLERWEKEGKIKAYRTPSGQRRYDCDSIVDIPSTKSTILYARVSSRSQKADLPRQTDFLLSRYPGCEIIQDIGSGLNFKRKGLIALLEHIYTGDIGMVVIASKDRLCRFGFDLISWFAERGGCKILVLNNNSLSPERKRVQDILAIIHVFSCRLYGLKKYKKQIIEDSDLPSVPKGGDQENLATEDSRQSKSLQ
ncbi:IS607 family transposase [Oscillatoria nigro-viridis]|uniref:IS607 family transposase n=1 Tax=Phormidium nigroviride TaxID=482564 RepID=UPI0005A1C9C7|nr:IS607 family transposase [Oscillatoria nigro-viridis]